MQAMFLSSFLLIAVIVGVDDARSKNLSMEKGPSLTGATNWLNTQPLALEKLRGKVVLIDFWTYTCINWRRTLPYIREWASKYKNQGLIVIGIHTPEFSFEYSIENVKRSAKEMKIGYPVAMDNNYEIWRSFDNHYWPALYLVDAKGRVRYQKFGEGDYAESELEIQKLLKEIPVNNVPHELVTLQPDGVEAAADWEHLQSSENFLGYGQTNRFASPQGLITDKPVLYSAPDKLNLNQWGLLGKWTMREEGILLNKAPGRIIYRFHARDVNLITGAAIPGKSIKFRILIDGKPPGTAHGLDIDSDGNGIITDQRMYQLIRQSGVIIDREFQIEFFDPEVEAYDFTFG